MKFCSFFFLSETSNGIIHLLNGEEINLQRECNDTSERSGSSRKMEQVRFLC